jgi:phage-related protein
MTSFHVRHFEPPNGRDPVQEFLEHLPDLDRAVCNQVINLLETGEINSHPRNRDYIGDSIWELRVSFSGKQYRFLYATESDEAFILVPFIKKTQQTPKNHIDLAKKRWRQLKKQQ